MGAHPKYTPLSKTSSDDDDDDDEERGSLSTDVGPETSLLWKQSYRKRFQQRWRWILLALSYPLVAGLTYFLTKHFGYPCFHVSHNEHLSEYFAGIDRSFHVEHPNLADGSRNLDNYDENNQSWNNFTVSSDIGGDKTESWWAELGVYTTPLLVPEKYGKEFNFDPAKHALLRPDGSNNQTVPYAGYAASIEVTHKLHCLNLLRQAAYYNHEYYRSVHHLSWSIQEKDLMRHIAHCVDILRQTLMCNADLTLVPFLGGDSPAPRNDWTVPRQCRNFASLRNWLKDHQWPEGSPGWHLDDRHDFPGGRGETFQKTTRHSMEQLWRGS